MEKSEQTLIPEWLKGSGNVTSGSSGTHQTTSSSLLHSDSDDHRPAMHSRNMASAIVNNHDSGRSSFSDRTTSSYFRWGSNNNGSGHLRGQGSFGNRNSHYRAWDNRDKDKSNLSSFKRHNNSNPLDNIFPTRAGKDLRRSQSLVTGRRDEPFSGKIAHNPNNSNSPLAGRGVTSTVHKTQFEREFPSLGTDKRKLNPDVRRVSSHGLGMAIQSLPIGVSSVLGSDGWTSALVDAPVILGNNGPSVVSPPSIPPNTTSIASSTDRGLNMAKTVAQGALRGNSTLQLSTGNLRLDELALKQSRQLIPLKTTPKSSAFNPTEKSKAKISQPHQVSSQAANLFPVGGAGKSSVGKLQLLKLSREGTEVPLPTKDNMSPQNGTSKVVAGVNVSLPSRTRPGNIVKKERSAGPTILEKRPNPHAESRNDFFNLMRKKSMTVPSSSSVVVVDTSANKNNEEAVVEDALGKEVISVVDEEESIKKVADNGVENNNGVNEEPINAAKAEDSVENEESTTSSRPCSPDTILHSEEEEVAFMRSLGWEESNNNTEDDEGLTEEEISAFYKHMDESLKLSPSSQTCRRLQSKLLGCATCSPSSSPRSSQV